MLNTQFVMAATRLMKRLEPRDIDLEIRNGCYYLRANSPAETETTAKLPNYKLKVIIYRAGRETMPNGLQGSRSAAILEWGIPMVSVCRGFAAGLLLTTMAGLYSAPVLAKPPGQLALTAERMAELQQVNNYVNSTIIEVSDMEQYGREDVWTLPASGKGDCEDFALLKRKILVQRGWPASALSISVGATSQGEAHAVLVVSTDRGEYVLDNLTSSILSPSQTGHVFYSRQSGRGWISASGARTAEPTADLPVANRAHLAKVGPRGRRG